MKKSLYFHVLLVVSLLALVGALWLSLPYRPAQAKPAGYLSGAPVVASGSGDLLYNTSTRITFATPLQNLTFVSNITTGTIYLTINPTSTQNVTVGNAAIILPGSSTLGQGVNLYSVEGVEVSNIGLMIWNADFTDATSAANLVVASGW